MAVHTFAELRTRRTVLQGLGAIAAGATAVSLTRGRLAAQAGHAAGHSSGRVPPGIRFGVQLNAFPIDPHRFDTFLDALREVRQVGYQGFESSFRNVGGQFDHPEPARRSIEQSGLTFFGIHIFFPNEGYDPKTHIAAPSVYEPVARGGAALGAQHLILSGAPCKDGAALQRKIEALNAAGRFARSAGLTAAYHNHWWEFQSKIGPGGTSEIEALYTQTDPALVSFLLDAGHAYHGGADVPAFIRAHAHRIIAFHLRDYRDGRLVTLGTGTFPLRQVAETIREIHWHGWVENEEERDNHSQTGLEVIAPAFKAMKEAFTA